MRNISSDILGKEVESALKVKLCTAIRKDETKERPKA
jgi:hypothetical protein